MEFLLPLTFLTNAYRSINYIAGFSSLTIYAITGAGELWQNFIDRCQEFEDNGGAIRGINCVGNDVFYLMGAVVAFGAGQGGSDVYAYGESRVGE
ncbi:hypothetical protein ONS96_003693 [Cadophora gregata f. sp. sojae]|nr:hypothetical protein ONS96_003693 [Cadophora gregata f. sp. sojae]